MKNRHIIGVITGHAGEYYTKQIIHGISQAGLNLNYDIVCFSNIYNIEKSTYETNCENRIYELALSKDIKGLILIPESIFDSGARSKIAENLAGSSVPIVIVGEETPEFYGSGYPSIQNNESEDMEFLTDHMLDEHGFRTIDLLTGAEGVKTTEKRTEGFVSSMKKHGINEDSYNIIIGDYWYSSGENLAARYASGELEISEAVICASDIMALGLLRGLAKHGIEVPEQIAVASYEYSDRRVYNKPILTCMERNRAAIGEYGMLVLHSMITKTESPSSPSFVGKMIYGESCGCSPEPEVLMAEYEDAALVREMNDWNPLASVEANLISCQNMKSFIKTLADYRWLIKNTENMYIRLFSEWYDVNSSETEDMYCYNITSENSEKFATSYYRISDITSVMPEPALWYFTPLFIGDRLFGNYILRFSTPGCYDFMFRNWVKSVSICLEHLRMKNDVSYLLSVQSLSDDKDSFTGMYNEKGIKKIITQLKHENAENLYFVLIQTYLNKDLIFDEERNQKDKAISLSAEAIREFCRFFGTSSHFGNGRFLCCVRYDSDIFLLEKILQAFLMHCGNYAKEFGTDSFVYSVTKFADSTYKSALKQAEKALSKRLSEYQKRKSEISYRKMLKLRNYMYSHPSETFSDKAFCDSQNESLTLVRSVYQSCFSVTFHNDCINSRISYAIYHLLKTSASGISVSEQCGYQDSKYFMRQFSSNTGMTMTEFRKLGITLN